MKALTICQPYAELIARGDKPIENRTWYTHYRGPIVIHAGRSREWIDGDEERVYGIKVAELPFGAVVAVGELVACLKMGVRWPEQYAALRDHEHANGPWCWVLENVRRVPVVPCRGAQGLWDVPAEYLR